MYSLYAIYDRIAEEIGPIFEAVNDAVAVRNVVNMCLNKQLYEHDYALWKLAQIDKKTGLIKVCDKIEDIDFITALIMKRSEAKK